MIQETKSNWLTATEIMHDQIPIQLGRYASYWYHRTPRRLLHSLSYYKFAAKLIGKGKRVLDVGCNEGMGTYLIGKECGYAKGVDFDEEAIAIAHKNFPENESSENASLFGEKCVFFEQGDIFDFPLSDPYDGVVHFDVIEHIFPEHVATFWDSLLQHLKPEGIMVLGTPSEISQTFASAISRKGHVNIYSHERLEAEMNRYFEHVFLFAANDEVVHTGFHPLAHYFLAVGCGKRR